MESHGTEADDNVAQVGEDINGTMAVAQAIPDTHHAQGDEHEVGCCIDELGNVGRDIVVLLTPVESACLGAPDAIPGFPVGPLKGERHGGPTGTVRCWFVLVLSSCPGETAQSLEASAQHTQQHPSSPSCSGFWWRNLLRGALTGGEAGRQAQGEATAWRQWRRVEVAGAINSERVAKGKANITNNVQQALVSY